VKKYQVYTKFVIGQQYGAHHFPIIVIGRMRRKVGWKCVENGELTSGGRSEGRKEGRKEREGREEETKTMPFIFPQLTKQNMKEPFFYSQANYRLNA
jgi:hypothetical protein